MLGVVELVLIVGLLVGIFVTVVRSQHHPEQNVYHRPSRVNWSKVGFVFLGIPFLIMVGLGGVYWLHETRSAHQVELHRAVEKDRAMAMARAAQQAELLRDINADEGDRISQIGGSESSPVGRSDDLSSFGVAEEDYGSSEEAHVAASTHEMPSTLGRFTESLTQINAVPIVLIIVLVGLVVGIILIARKSVPLASGILASLLILLGLGTTLTVSKSSVSRSASLTQQAHNASSLPALPSLDDLDESVPSEVLVRAGESAEQPAESPLQIQRLGYDFFSDGQSMSSQSINEIPDWLERAKDQQVFELNENEVILTSQRFSSRAEAEAQLKSLVNSIMTEKLVELYPEIQVDWIQKQSLLSYGIVMEGCELTWPFQVGNFTDEVYQVAWKLQLTQPIQKRLYALWQEDELVQRLTYLGGAFGLVTLLLGAGAVLTRAKKEVKQF